MINIKTKYIILIWIIILILFIFYCLFRIKYITKNIQEKYLNIPIPKNTNENVIDWINNMKKTSNITDVSKECKYVYDDNYKVSILGYSDCETAYNDYVNKGYNVNNKFGQTESLAEICPVSTKSPLYINCLKKLLFKFTNSANISTNINNEFTAILNDRLYDRNKIINNIQTEMKPYINSKEQTDFTNFMDNNNAIANYPEDVIGLVDNYYANRYKTGYKIGSTVENFIDSADSSSKVDSDIEALFFGNYKPLDGQFLVLDDINIMLDYNINDSNTTTTKSNPSSQESSQPQASIQPKASTQPEITKAAKSTKPQRTAYLPTESSIIKKIILTITNKNGLKININIDNIKKFNETDTAIILKPSNITVINKPKLTETQYIQQLLTILGIEDLTYLVLIYDEYTSSENILHKTYKLVNKNLDTIILLNKKK